MINWLKATAFFLDHFKNLETCEKLYPYERDVGLAALLEYYFLCKGGGGGGCTASTLDI